MSPVSVLIPCHNNASTVGEAIDSALSQSAPVEVIVVDDGSTDSSVDVIRKFEKQIRWEAGPQLGAPGARNRLLHLSTTEWVQYLDADDYLLPNKIQQQLVAVEQAPEAEIVYGPVVVEWQTAEGPKSEIREIPEPHDPWIQLALWHLPQTGGPLWRRQTLLDVGGWKVDQPCCQEHELYLRLLIAGRRFLFCPASGAVYRRFESGTLSTRNMKLVRQERMKIEQRAEEYLRSIGQLTFDRQWAINQARFEMARSAWVEDRDEARTINAAIKRSMRGFVPAGKAAPRFYQSLYRSVGFEGAEQVASIVRSIRRAASD